MTARAKILCVICLFALCLAGLIAVSAQHTLAFSPDMTLRQFALANGIKPGHLKAELDTPSVRGRTTLHSLGLDEKKAYALVSHIRGDVFGKKMAGLHLLFAAAVFLAACSILGRAL